MADWDVVSTQKANPWDVVSEAKPEETAKTQPSSSLADVGRSAAGGLAKGIGSVAGLPGDLQGGVDWISSKLFGLNAEQARQMAAAHPHLPTSKDITDLLQGAMGGEYNPQTEAGKYAETVGSFAPAALAPGGLAMRAARTVVPAVASEFAGQKTAGTGIEPLARLAGAVAGGAPVEGAVGAITHAARGAAVPTVDELRKAATALYKQIDNAGIIIKDTSYQKLVQDITNTLAKHGATDFNEPRTIAALRLMEREAVPGTHMMFTGLDNLRQITGRIIADGTKSEKAAAYKVRDEIDDFFENLKPQDVLSKNPQQAVQWLTTARNLWSRMRKSEDIEKLIDKAAATSSEWSGKFGDALRREFSKVARNERAMSRYSPEEQEAIKEVARGTVPANIFHFIGKFSPHNIAQSVAGGFAGRELFGTAGEIAVPAVGLASRYVGQTLTKRAAERASEAARRGYSVPRSAAENALLPLGLEARSGSAQLSPFDPLKP